MDENKYLDHLQELWDKNWPETALKETLYPLGEIPLTEYLAQWAALTPDKTAVIFYGYELTFKNYNEMSSQFASFLISKGLKKGDRVGVMMPNCPQFLIAFYGILKCGCIYVPINPMFKKAELLYELNDAEPELLVVLDHLFPLVQSIQAETSVKTVVTTRFSDCLPEQPTIPLPKDLTYPGPECPGSIDMMSILAEQDPNYPPVDINLDDVAALNYTGGTTGLPKGCEHTQRDMLYTIAAVIGTSIDPTTQATQEAAQEELGETSLLSYFPLFWIAGENAGLIAPVMTNMSLVLLTRWDAEAVLVAIDRYRVSSLVGVVDSLLEIMNRPDSKKYDLSSLKSASVSSFVTKLDSDIRQNWKSLSGSTVRENSFGMTETHTSDTFTNGMQVNDMDLKSRPGFCGLPVPGTTLKIVDFHTQEVVPLGEEGEIAIKTPSLMKGYWKNPEATAKDIVDGWFHTGDIGLIDENGYFFYIGRKKEMLKIKGMSIFPTEIEHLVSMHPAVEGCSVLGKSDPEKGEIPVAFVQLKEKSRGNLTETEMTAWCHENMAVYKVPVIRFIKTLPLTVTGKVDKKELVGLT
jgi:long-chain acyl-CoA synthetase